jgi:hypothetical protein
MKETIRLKNQEINLKIRLGLHDAFTGFQQEIDNLTTITTNDLINPIVDKEVRRFKNARNGFLMDVLFYNNASNQHGMDLTYVGFTNDELTTKSLSAQNSFFILEYYDSYDIYEQNKIFTTYFTKIGEFPYYIINSESNSQFYYWYIPISYINSQTGNTVTGYTKFSFYNAKLGKIHVFYNGDYESESTSLRLYFKTILNLANNTWNIQTPSYSNLGVLNLIELSYNTYKQYIDRVNDTIGNFENLAQAYPSGNTFNYLDRKYYIT